MIEDTFLKISARSVELFKSPQEITSKSVKKVPKNVCIIIYKIDLGHLFLIAFSIGSNL